ncbi:MAG: prepilin-type N-terminal cleavage/methylation domain-containing protein [bacterium]|nr:prepilin-type N-terminal cleavage/methylation domain-containing protein [bacterium]
MLSKRNFGFTLVELLVVIAILGLLSTLSFISIDVAKKRAKDATRLADLKQIQLALELYHEENYTYPATLNVLLASGFMVALPVPPSPSLQASYSYSALGMGSKCDNFHLGAVMEQDDLPALNFDADTPAKTACDGSVADFDGNASDCASTNASSPDVCYDISP